MVTDDLSGFRLGIEVGIGVDIDAASTCNVASVSNFEWSIQDVARIAGTTSRTLRHYGDVGLLAPSRVGSNGYRYYDAEALTRLQRILMLRDLGLGIPAIAAAIDGRADDAEALGSHLHWLVQERSRLDRQIASVETTIRKLEGGEHLMAEQMFDGFEHTRYRDEVEDRWGGDAYRKGDAWWRSKSKDERAAYQAQHAAIAADYSAARAAGKSADSEDVQAIVARHVEWLNLTAEFTGGPITAVRLRGYGDMYVGDPRFAANYGGIDGAEYVRDAFAHYADTAL
ncbi:MAG: MerR family transcriptional regulator, thiopeptide resistance regulator [Actinomycetota bacterium]|nr:MerR family transcriptional regulator, thiopeptide resistance regulator [Actinomycetota bacterium]